MATMIVANPIRATSLHEHPIAIAMSGPAAVGAYAEAQSGSKLVQVAGDAARHVLTKATADALGHVTIPGISALAQASKTCKYMRHLSRDVTTPIDAHVVDKTTFGMAIGDPNLNGQRFWLRALVRRDGTPAGARFELKSHQSGIVNGFLIVYRDCTKDFDRPVVVVLAIPLLVGGHVCIELSTRDLLHVLGGHSKLSPFRATAGIPPALPSYTATRTRTTHNITVWGDDDAYAANIDETALEEDSINPVAFQWDFVSAREPTAAEDGDNDGDDDGDDDEDEKVPAVKLITPPSTCGVLCETTFNVANVDALTSLFGANETPAAACMPTEVGPMIPGQAVCAAPAQEEGAQGGLRQARQVQHYPQGAPRRRVRIRPQDPSPGRRRGFHARRPVSPWSSGVRRNQGRARRHQRRPCGSGKAAHHRRAPRASGRGGRGAGRGGGARGRSPCAPVSVLAARVAHVAGDRPRSPSAQTRYQWPTKSRVCCAQLVTRVPHLGRVHRRDKVGSNLSVFGRRCVGILYKTPL